MKLIYFVLMSMLMFFLVVSVTNGQEPETLNLTFLPLVVSDMSEIDCRENWKLIKPDGTTNKVLNPSAEAAGNFASVGGGVASRVVSNSFFGLQSYNVVTSANNEGVRLTLSTLGNVTHFVTLRVTGNLPPSWDWSLDDASYRVPVLIESIDGDWDLYGLSFPASEANGSTTLFIRQNGAGSGDFFIDGIQVEAKTYGTTYCDGTQEGCSWAGTAHASISERSSQSRAGGRVLDLWNDFGFFVEEVVGVGAAPVSVDTRSYAILPGGELSGSKTESRNFTLIGRFIADSEQDLHAKRQELIEELGINTYPESQAIRIRFSGAEVQKQISAHYTGGLEAQLKVSYGPWQVEGQESWRKLRHWTERVPIQFLAPDPMWFEIGESSVLLDTNDSATLRIITARLRSTGQWDDLGPPALAGGSINAIAEDGTYIYLGGSFANFDGIANADNIVRLNKQTGVYSALSTGMDDDVKSLVVAPDGTLFAGGVFLNAGGGAVNRIASWDGAAWSTIGPGPGFNSDVNALVIGLDGLLYIGGGFTDIDGGPGGTYNRIVSWDGTSLAALGTGMDAVVLALAIGLDGTIFAGGSFTTAGGGAAAAIAQWDGSSWSALGSGVNVSVFTLAVGQDGILYAGGNFTVAGGNAALRIAQWNGTAWFTLGSGMDALVNSLEVAPDNFVFAGGQFTEAGGVTLANRVARWNGASWAHLDIVLPGAPPAVLAILATNADPVVISNYDLWLGFTQIGTGDFAGLVTATNDGTQTVFPRIFYSRSGGTSAILETLRNETTGRLLLFDYSLLDGETLTIDLTPTNKSIISSQFGSRLDAVFANSDFGTWSLQPNDNDITSFVDVAGGPDVTSFLLWKDTYRSFD